MDTDLDGQAVLVTGASSGIGRATAVMLASVGADVALMARREEALKEVATAVREQGAATIVVPADLRNERATERAVDRSVERFGRLDALVNNAGVGRGFGEGVDVDTADYRAMMETNVDGAFFATRRALPHLRTVGGNLVFVGSMAGQYPYPSNPVYAATNAWLRSFARSVEALAGGNGVAVTVVNPGGIRTTFDIDGMTQADRYDEGEAPEPDEVAEMVVAALGRSAGATLSMVDLYRRDQISSIW